MLISGRNREPSKLVDILTTLCPACCLQGASVTASDISEAMAKEAEQRYKAASSEPGAKKPRKVRQVLLRWDG